MTKGRLIEKIGNVTAVSVEKHTRRNWNQWIEILDGASAHNLTHKEIVALLKRKFKVSVWWQQIITTHYEYHIGRRLVGQSEKGTYSLVVTRTFEISSARMWKFLISEVGTIAWLTPMSPINISPGKHFEVEGGIFGEIRTLKKGSRIRLRWQDSDWLKASTVQVNVISRPKGKCMLAIQHDGLKDARDKQKMISYWKQKVDQITSTIKR